MEEKKSQAWMILVGMGFLAGIVFGFLVNVDNQITEQVDITCGICQSNLVRMVDNFNAASRFCPQMTSMATNYSTMDLNKTLIVDYYGGG